VRIRGVLIPSAHLWWAATSAAVVLLGVLVAVVVGASGVFFGTSAEDQGTSVPARVVTGVPCDRPGATETVSLTHGGRAHRVRFDGCGHARDEPVEVTVPTGALPADLVVHAADAARGDGENGEGLGLLLIVVSGVAGAAYAFLVRRGALPAVLRLA
jgi:hypothetical protein